jgi:hypothetical protein
MTISKDFGDRLPPEMSTSLVQNFLSWVFKTAKQTPTKHNYFQKYWMP